MPDIERSSVNLDEFERRVLETEEPLTAALDVLHPEGWTEHDADVLGDAIVAAIEAMRDA